LKEAAAVVNRVLYWEGDISTLPSGQPDPPVESGNSILTVNLVLSPADREKLNRLCELAGYDAEVVISAWLTRELDGEIEKRIEWGKS
jgi:hypothetical protein